LPGILKSPILPSFHEIHGAKCPIETADFNAAPTRSKNDMSTRSSGATAASSLSFARRDLVVLLLSVAGGGVDAVIILGFHVLTAAQTGNTILLAVALAEGRFATGLHAAVSVIGYMVGAATGELVIIRHRDSASWLSPVDWGLVVELVALTGLLVSWHLAGQNSAVGRSAGLVVFAAIAMGIQSVVVFRLHVGPTTTYVTGTLTTFITETVRRLHLIETAPAPSLEAHDRGAGILSPKGPVMYGVAWLVYAGGACVSGLLFLRVREVALALPIVAIVAAIVAGVHRR
jgi:uncharacterized membrane protein YoaK (UPF0700 family)